jgi:hypothetical protein
MGIIVNFKTVNNNLVQAILFLTGAEKKTIKIKTNV